VPDPLRRRFVMAGGALVGAATTFGVCGLGVRTDAPRDGIGPEAHARIMLHSLASGEEVDLEYRRGGAIVPPALARIDVLLRDPVTGERGPIDTGLIDFLRAIAAALAVPPEFDVLAGFESPRRSGSTRGSTRGSAHAARTGLHGVGRAIDVRLRGVAGAELAACAACLSRGGVGYYRAAQCVHVDTGPSRHWRG
jgi:uncharacterized protein YcbK (DUF882 family)